MQIECLLRRPKPTVVKIGSDTYTFAPNAAGAHVADVEDEEHASMLLAIKEGYRKYVPPASAEPAKTSAAQTGIPVSGLSTPPAGGKKRLSAKAQQARNDAVSAYVDAFGSQPDESLSASDILKAVEEADQSGDDETKQETPPAS